MKRFSFSPLLMASLAASVLSGCAAAIPGADSRQTSMAAGEAGRHHKMTEGGCSCCNMHKEGMPPKMKLGDASSQQGAMCMPGKDGSGKAGCGCCDMGKMGSGGCSCCGMGKQ